MVPEHGVGLPGPARSAGPPTRRHGSGRRASPFGRVVDARSTAGVVVEAVDPVAELRLVTRRHARRRAGGASAPSPTTGDTRYLLDALHLTLPLPAHAAELLTFDGRWTRELHPVRRDVGQRRVSSSENRAGRTSHEHPPLVFAGTPGFGEWHGEVWGAHLAWSGNHALARRGLPDGRRYVQLGELLHPGELCSSPASRTRRPTVVGVYSADGPHAGGVGLPPLAARRPGRTRRRPRPVLLNTWEAVYFDHDNERLQALADRGRRRWASSGSCSTTAGSGRGATTPAASATGGCRPRCTPTGWRR